MKFILPLFLVLFLTVNGCLRINWPDKCSPTDPATFLFAYSNDLDYIDVEKIYAVYDILTQYGSTTKYVIAATARFDTKTKEEIVFHGGDTLRDSYLTARNYIQEQKVDPSQSFENSETGSDVLDMLEKFVDSSHPKICGSHAIILMKRSPNEVEISRIVRKIRQYNIQLGIGIEDPSSGGLFPGTMYDLAAKTNGVCSFGSVIGRAFSTLPTWGLTNVYYSLNIKVSGTGTMTLPTLPVRVKLSALIGVRSTATAESFQNLTLSWRNPQNGTVTSFTRTREQLNTTYYFEDLERSESTNLNVFTLGNFLDLEAATYEVKLDYNYSMEDTILIRMLSYRPIDHWLPFQD
ncbi:unnamed protein product [Caenorhabditis nigoni]